MNLWYNFQYQILRKCWHCRPVFDIRSELDLCIRISHTMTIKYTICINLLVKVVFLSLVFYVHICCRCQETFICCCCCNWTGIHKCNGCNLSTLKLGTFTVREVSCRVANRKCIICRCISSSKAWSAECCFYNCSCFHKIRNCTVFHKFHIDWCTCRIYTKCKFIWANVMTFDDVCCCADIFKSTTGTSCDDSLIHIKFSINHFILKWIIHSTIQAHQCFLLYIVKHVFQILTHVVDCIYIWRMEWHCDHRTDLA